MRFKPRVFPPDGTKRVITKFCWFPTYIEEINEYVWLEKVTIEQVSNRKYFEAEEWIVWDNIRIVGTNNEQ